MRTVKKSFVKTTLATSGKLAVDVVMTSGRVYCPVGAVGIEGKVLATKRLVQAERFQSSTMILLCGCNLQPICKHFCGHLHHICNMCCWHLRHFLIRNSQIHHVRMRYLWLALLLAMHGSLIELAKNCLHLRCEKMACVAMILLCG